MAVNGPLGDFLRRRGLDGLNAGARKTAAGSGGGLALATKRAAAAGTASQSMDMCSGASSTSMVVCGLAR